MRRRHGNRARLSVVLLAALGALVLLALPSVAAAKDRNNDRIPDRWEVRHHLSLSVKQSGRDQDRDRLTNRGEFRAGDDPRDRDSDDDGVMDGDENAGTIASFDPTTGKLTINLYGGDTVSGLVIDRTRIKCGHGCSGDDSTASASHDGDDEDNSGPGNSSDDEDNSGPGNSGDDESSGPSGGGADDPANHDENDDHGHHSGDDPPGHDGTPPGSSEGPGHGADNSASCTTDALVVGAVVDEAELELKSGVATFEEVELADDGS